MTTNINKTNLDIQKVSENDKEKIMRDIELKTEEMVKNGKHKKAENSPATYYVMSLSDNREKGID
jgi:hypothetical protein